MNVFDLKTKKPTALCFSEVGPVCEKKTRKQKKDRKTVETTTNLQKVKSHWAEPRKVM